MYFHTNSNDDPSILIEKEAYKKVIFYKEHEYFALTSYRVVNSQLINGHIYQEKRRRKETKECERGR